MATLATIPTPTGHEDVVRALLTFGAVRPANLRGNDRGVTLTGDLVFDGDAQLMFNGFNSVNASRGSMRARRTGGNGFVSWRGLSAANLRAEWRIAQNDGRVLVCTTVGTVQEGRWDLSVSGMVAAANGGTMAVLVSRPVPAPVEVLVSGTATRGTPTAAGIVRDEAVDAVTVAGTARRGVPTAAGIVRAEEPGAITVAGTARRGVPTTAGVVVVEVVEVAVSGTAVRGVPTAAGIVRSEEAGDAVTVSGTARRGVPTAAGVVTTETPAPVLVGGTATRGAPTAAGIVRDEDPGPVTVSGVARRGVPTAAGIVRDEAVDAVTVSGTARRGVPTAAGVVEVAAPIVLPPGVTPVPAEGGFYRVSAPRGNYSTAATEITTLAEAD